MRMIVGLGNPGKQYANTRHNAGFSVIDLLCEKLGVSLDKEKFKALYGIVQHGSEKVIIVKPLTYMNLSGEAVSALMRYYDIPVEDLIVVHDDLDLPVGKIRLRTKGSGGGQKGMGNIIDHLGTKEIFRIRIGVGNDKDIDTKDYVLSPVGKEDLPSYEAALSKARDALIFALENRDFSLVMNRFNI